MSSAVISTTAASSRPFLFDASAASEVYSPFDKSKKREFVIDSVSQSKIGNRQSAIPIIPASRLQVRPTPEMASSGIAALDSMIGGLPRGCLTEICGPASSGRTTVLLAALAAATRRGEFCALIDASDSLDPHSAAAAGIDLDRLLWVRCGEESLQKNSPRRHRDTERSSFEINSGQESPTAKYQSERRLEQVLRATDLLLESGGFGLITLDLADLPIQAARRIPLTTWFRFRRAIENKPTILLAIEQHPIAGSCSSLLLKVSSQFAVLNSQKTARQIEEQQPKPSHTQLLTGLEISAELLRSRLAGAESSDFDSPLKTYRKPAGSISIAFNSKTSWG